MAVIFSMSTDGRVTIYPYAVTDGTKIVPCKNEDYAEKLLQNSRYAGYALINSDTPSDKLLETLKGVRFDSLKDAENFINGGGYEESVLSRVEDIEIVVAEMIGG